jgi:protein-disulfide isomerase
MTHNEKSLMIGLIILGLVLAGCQQTLSDSVEAAEVAQSTPVAVQPAAGPTPASIAPAEAALILGDPDAPVTIVEYSDYQCPFCAQYTSDTWSRLKAEFVDSGRVKYVFKDFPLTNIHPQAPKAHEAARCAGEQGAYWEMHDLLFVGQAEWAVYPDHLTVFKRYAAGLELDTAAFDACLDSGSWAEAMNADLAEGARLGVRGTPSFFVDGYPLVGAQPYETFQYAIELAEQGKLGDAYELAP